MHENSKKERKDFYVYAYLRSRDSEHGEAGSPYYIGKGEGRRRNHSNHRISVPDDAARIAIIGRGLSEEDAFLLEKSLIRLYGRIDNGTGCLRNLTDGGEGASGHKHSEEALAKMAAARTGTKHSVETRAKISESQKGRTRVLSASTREAIAAANALRTVSAETRKKLSEANRRRKHSPEAREKISKAHKGRTFSAEHRTKMSKTRKGRKLTPEHRTALREAWERRKAKQPLPVRPVEDPLVLLPDS